MRMKSRRKFRKKDLLHHRFLLTAALGLVVLIWAFWLQLRGPTFPPTDVRYLCMVEDKVFADQTLLVRIEGATYYACRSDSAQMARNASYRTAVDPLTGRMVDKSKAVLRQDREDNKVYYFENYENAKTFMHIRLYGRQAPHRRRNR